MEELDLASRYRPQKFENVVGQDFPVQYLSALIKRGHKPQNLLLHGSVGSGKTSLVRLYAKALNCEMPEAGGSPCGTCKSCSDTSRGWCSEYDVSGQGGSEKKVTDWTDWHNRKHVLYRHRVLFYDEAHSLSTDAADALLKKVEEAEEAKEGVCFCFATTEKGSMRRALQSRLQDLEVKPLSIHDAVALMRCVAIQENIQFETSALKALAGLKDGYPRDLLNGLAQVYGPEKQLVSLENVRKQFDTSHVERLIEYFTALAEGDERKQTLIFSQWQEPGFRKIAWIQAFLTSLYFNDVLGHDTVVDALMDSITDLERTPIIEEFCRRRSAGSRRALEPFWRSMMAFWPIPASTPSDIDVLLRLALFHHLVNDDPPQPRTIGLQDSHSDTVEAIAAPIDAGASSNSTIEDTDENPRFLTSTDVRNIINSASFLVQAHGVHFNARFDLRLASGGPRTHQNAVDLISQFCRELEQKVIDWGKGDRFAGLTVLERYPGTLHGFVLVHLPRISSSAHNQDVDCLLEVEGWYRDWLRERTMKSHDETVTLRSQAESGAAAWIFHWDQTLDLCAGLDSTLKRFDKQRRCDRPLHELLGLSGKLRQSGAIDAGIVTRHGLLRAEALAQSKLFGMNLFSAFDAQDWPYIQDRWELDEFHSRRKKLDQRLAAIEALELEHGCDTPEGRLKRQSLERSWLLKAEERRKNGPGWWLKEDV